MNFALALAIAISFWGDRGVQVPCTPTVVAGRNADRVLPKDQWGLPAEAGADQARCIVYISSQGQLYRRLKDMKQTYCMNVVHEVGHLAGIPHSETIGLMSAETDDRFAPWDCWHWRSAKKRLGVR